MSAFRWPSKPRLQPGLSDAAGDEAGLAISIEARARSDAGVERDRSDMIVGARMFWPRWTAQRRAYYTQRKVTECNPGREVVLPNIPAKASEHNGVTVWLADRLAWRARAANRFSAACMIGFNLFSSCRIAVLSEYPCSAWHCHGRCSRNRLRPKIPKARPRARRPPRVRFRRHRHRVRPRRKRRERRSFPAGRA